MYHIQLERMNDISLFVNKQVHCKHLMNKIEMIRVEHQWLQILDQLKQELSVDQFHSLLEDQQNPIL
jgi:hypothetical protein